MRQSRDIGLRLLSARTGMIIPQGLRLISDRHLQMKKSAARWLQTRPTTQAKTFVRGFQSYLRQNAERIALNGGTDEVAAVSALGYDAYMTMVTALESLDGTKDVLTSVDLRNALYEVDYEGVTGDISFDDNGDAIRDTAYLKQIQNGKFVFLKKQVDETE